MDPTNANMPLDDDEKLRALLREGEESGEPIPMTREEWDKIWREANRNSYAG